MKNYLLNIMKQKKHGLYMCELPTGKGKTFDSVWAMKEYAEQIEDDTKIIYLTTLNKNLPEDALKSAYGNEKLYNKNVLRIRSNFDEVVEKILDIDVPEEIKRDTYIQLSKNVSLYKKALEKKISDKEYISDLKNRITENDGHFRYQITKLLKTKFPTVLQRKNAIKNDKNYQWIGKLYPAVFTDDYKIILMSVSKFLKRNSILIDSSYEFLNSNLIENAIILIDEFDATKNTIQCDIINKSLAIKDDYIMLFRQISNNLNLNYYSFDIKRAVEQVENSSNKNTLNSLLNLAETIQAKYHTRLSIKTKENHQDQKQNFLFNDGSFHTILKDRAQYIRSTLNEETNKIDIFFESKEDFYENSNKENDIVLYGLLREINTFTLRFRIFCMEWAKNYMNIVNSSRNELSDSMNLENATSTILNIFQLTNNQRDLLLGETCQMVKNKKDAILQDRSFYQTGMEYYEFEDNDSHHDNTNLKLVKIYDTPEKILLHLSEKATIFGISATAEIDTVVGNYDLNYLQEQLGEKFHKTPEQLTKSAEAELKERWKAYTQGKINVHIEKINNNIQSFNAEDYCKTFLNQEFARYSANIITEKTNNEFKIIRYCNILKAMCRFNENDDIQSMLYLGMALPKKDNTGMDEEVLIKLFDYSKKCLSRNINSDICFLKGDNFEQDKETLQNRLANGEKIFVMSSYQTIGAGQNIQYKIPENSTVVYLGDYCKDDSRFLYKDFDALYLGDYTHMAVNTYNETNISSQELLNMLFQIEELYENGEMNYSDKDKMLKLAFNSYIGNKEYSLNLLYKLKSILVQASRMVLQAVGRMCRTFAKSENIYLFIESNLLDKLDVGELKKRILPPEMKKIVLLSEELGKDYTINENILLNEAEKISSKGLWTIRQILSKDWTKESMLLWETLRDLVLKYPTACIQDWENNEYLQKLYITSGTKQNQYLYSQYSDFSDVIIDFGSDKLYFKNSNRAKIKGNSNELAIYEMNMKESGLTNILNYPGMKEYFITKGYALEFKKNEYLMSPVLFHNIYKGALGEIAGKFILSKELGVNLQPITEHDYFEFFDYKLSNDVYIDFKNWKYTYVQDKEEIRQNILRKIEHIGAKRVYVINVYSSKKYAPSSTKDQRLIEIPMLINNDGSVCYENLHMILKEDFENVD